MDRLQAMQAFVEVVEAGSFTAAAERMNMSKSQVSKLISGLEAHLGSQLLQRNTRALTTTESGATYLEQSRQILAAIDQAEEEAQDLARAPKGVLKVSASVGYGTRKLLPMIGDFHAAYPEIVLDLELNDRLVDLVHEGFDLAIRVGRPADSNLKQSLLEKQPFITLASKAYLEKAGVPKTPDALIDHDCLLYSLASNPRRWTFLGTDGQEQQVKVDGPLMTNSGDFVLQATIDGLGVGQLPRFFAEEALASGALVEVLDTWRSEDLTVSAVYPSTQHLSRKARVFIDFLRQHSRTKG